MTLLRFFPYLVGLALAVSACGGGGGGAAPGGGGPTPCPAGFTGVAPACNPITASGTIALGTTASTAALPSAGGYTASVQLPSASPSTTASVTTSTQTPAGITALSSTLRRPLAVNSPLLYFTFVPAATVTLNGIPGFTITLPASVSPSQSFYLAFYQNGSWQTFAGPGSVAGQTVTFAPATSSIVLTANQPVYFALYAGAVLPTPSPTPTPSPSPTPSPTPTASPTPTPTATPTPCTQSTITVAPCSLSFLGTGASHAQQLTVSETGYSGVFTAQINDCAAVVSVSPAMGTSFTVTPNGTGSCTLKIVDSSNHTASVATSVTVTQVGGQ